MAIKTEILDVATPALFTNFVERQTRGQRRRHAVARVKFVVKWVLNWKGIRNA
jgi:hypothetical protein